MMVFTNKILKEAEDKHYKFQMGCYFSDSKKIQGAVLLWSYRIKDSYWNFVTKIDIDKKSLSKLMKKIVAFYKTKNRKLVIYFTPFTKPQDLPLIIKKSGFKSKYKDAWMFYEKTMPRVVMPKNFIIKQVRTRQEMRLFVDVFNRAYSGTTPEEAYGALPKEYRECLFDSFIKLKKDKTVIHYLGILNKKPVGIATLIYSGNFGCIYNVGTIPNYRKKGIGSTLTLNAVADSMRNNAKIVFLQTEQKSYNEKYYTGLGFSTKFIGEGFILE